LPVLTMPLATATWFAPANRLKATNNKDRFYKIVNPDRFKNLSGFFLI
jgi:hypothetical protein